MRNGLIFANSLGILTCRGGSDSLIVVENCTGQTTWWDSAAGIFAECVDAASLIGKVVFKHCVRSSNQVTHVLANYSFCNKACSSWCDEPTACLIFRLLDDVIPVYIQ